MMRINSILWLARALAAISLLLVIFLVGFYSPYASSDSWTKSYSIISAFLFLVFIYLASLTTLIFFRIRRRFFEENLWGANFGISLRQGILLSLAAVALLALQLFRVLTWWDGLLVVGAVMMMELYFLAR